MGIGVTLPASGSALQGAENAVDLLLGQAREAAGAGLDSVWFSQQVGVDALSMAALAGREVPGLAVGTAVVPMYPRHPIVLASQAQTAQAAARGLFTLGLGLGAPGFVDRVFGVQFDRPVRHLRDYLKVLRSIFDTGTVSLHGPTITAELSDSPFPSARVPGAPPVPILVAALGPQALRAAGELADGTLPLLVGPEGLARHIVPAISAAAQAAGRPAPRVVAAVPVVVTADPQGVREIAKRTMGFYGLVPSYRRVLNLQGVKHASELAVIGSEEEVAREVDRYFEAGATDVVFTQTGMNTPEDRERTWALAGELARRRRKGA